MPMWSPPGRSALRGALLAQLAVCPVLAAHAGATAWGGQSLARRGLLADWLLASLLGGGLLCWQRRPLPGIAALIALLGLLFGAAHAKLAALGDWPRWSDLALWREALAVLPAAAAAAIALGAAALALLAANLRLPSRAGVALSAALLAAGSLPLGLPGATCNAIDAVFHWWPWVGNDPFSRGLLVALARDAAEARLASRMLADLEPLPSPRALGAGTTRNLHVVMAESLTDPRDLGAGFPSASFDPRLAAWSRASALAPRYGTGSAQSEFELLCGLPASAALPDPVVFNGLRGRPVPCLPRRLAALGYRTIASVPVEPWFYNARRAYTSLGFEEARFAPELPPGSRPGAASSTRELMRDNRRLLATRLAGDRPLFNYVVTVEPHFPFGATPSPGSGARPPARTRLAAGLREATRAIADHVEWLLERDPGGLIVVVGDHQTPGFAEGAAGPRLRRLRVPLALLDAGVPRAAGLVPHYELTELLLARLDGAPWPSAARPWLRPLQGGSAFFSRGDGIGFCPDPRGERCAAVLAKAAALEARTRRLVAMAR
jgi:hypothetical protein